MKHSVLKYPEDIRLSINDIESYTNTISSYQSIEDNQLLFDGLCRRFAIIGEALYQADKLKTLPVTGKVKIIGLRHIIVHDYDTVRAPDLWNIIQTKLPLLKKETELLLKELDTANEQ